MRQLTIAFLLLISAGNLFSQADITKNDIDTTIFDRAVLKQNKEWKCYTSYTKKGELNREGKKILESIDSLDLSNHKSMSFS